MLLNIMLNCSHYVVLFVKRDSAKNKCNEERKKELNFS